MIDRARRRGLALRTTSQLLDKMIRRVSCGTIIGKKYARDFCTGPLKSVIYNWGIGTSGQLGHERFELQSTYFSGDVYIQQEPRRLVNSSRIDKVACGVGFSIAATHDKKLLAWGNKYPGRTLTDETSKTPNLIETDFDVVGVSAAKSHCAVVDSKGRVYTWGENGQRMNGGGQLGIGSYDFAATPTLVKSLSEAGVFVNEVHCGEVHTLFFDRGKGEVWACGVAAYGRLGIGANWSDQDALTPQLIQEAFEGERVVQISAGFSHSLALTESGRVFSWGRNDLGQLGLGDSFTDMYSMEDYPRLVESSKMTDKVVQISAGKGVSAALTESGKIFHWGHNIMLEPTELSVPDEDELNRPVVVKVAGDSAKNGAITTWVTADGELHTMGSYKSHLRGKKEGGFFSSDSSTLVDVGKSDENRKVFEIFTGFGQHMMAKVSPPLISTADQ